MWMRLFSSTGSLFLNHDPLMSSDATTHSKIAVSLSTAVWWVRGCRIGDPLIRSIHWVDFPPAVNS